MLAALFAWSYAILIFALVGESETEWLRIIGILGASFMALSGAVAGWQAARDR